MKRTLAILLLCAILVSLPGYIPAGFATEGGVGALQLRAAPVMDQSSPTDGMIRVWLHSIRNQTVYNVTVSGVYTAGGVTLQNGSKVTVEYVGNTIYATVNGVRSNVGTDFTLARVSGGLKIAESLAPGNTYPGNLRFTFSGGEKCAICTLYIEDYVYGVLPYEMDDSFPLEALKAQAVSARTYAARVKSSSGLYDVTDSSTHRIFRGVNASKTRCIQAADDTKGLVLTYDGKFIEPSFGVSNGGQTELNSNAWGGSRLGYYTIKDDPFDLANPQSVSKSYMIYSKPAFGASTSAYSLISAALAQKNGGVAGNYSITEIADITLHTPKYTSPSKLYTRMSVTVRYNNTMTATVDIPIFPTVKSGLGLGINSTDNELFSVTRESNGFQITSRRYGHGVGMSQRGAQQMASQNYTYLYILGFYYGGTTLYRQNFVTNWGVASPTQSPGGIFPTAAPTGSTAREGRVTLANPGSRLNLRSNASLNGDVIARMYHNDAVTILSEEGTWYRVQYGSITGYVAKSYVTVQQGGNTGGNETTATVIAPNGSLVMRSEARAAGTAIANIPNGASVTVLSRDTTWSLVKYNGILGYVTTQNLSASQTPTATPTPAAFQTIGTVSLLNANESASIYAAASSLSGEIGRIPNGTKVQVLEETSGWARVTYQGITGYVISTCLVMEQIGSLYTPIPVPTAAPTAAPGQSRRAYVTLTSGSLNMRALPNADADLVTRIPNGAEVYAVDTGDAWCGVTYGNYSGYVMRRYLHFTDATATLAPVATATPSAGGQRNAWITSVGNALLMPQPSTTGTAIGAIPAGSQVYVVSYDGQWAYVQFGTYAGYVLTTSIAWTNPSAAPTNAPTSDTYVYISTSSGGPVNLRGSASTRGAILDTLAHGTKVMLISSGNDWTQVSTGKTSGYVASQYVSRTEPPVRQNAGQATPVPSTAAVNQGRVQPAQGAVSVSLRVAADASAQEIIALGSQTVVEVLQYAGYQAQWLYVRSGTVMGYLPRENVTLSNGVAQVATINTEGVAPVYHTTDTLATTVASLRQGAIVTVLGYPAVDWVQVRIDGGATGYMPASFLQFL